MKSLAQGRETGALHTVPWTVPGLSWADLIPLRPILQIRTSEDVRLLAQGHKAEKWKDSTLKLLSHVRLFETPRTVAYQAPPSMEFFRQEYWSRLPFPSPGEILTLIRNKTRVPNLTTTIQHSFGSVGHSNQGRKRSKRSPDRKRRSETLAVCR